MQSGSKLKVTKITTLDSELFSKEIFLEQFTQNGPAIKPTAKNLTALSQVNIQSPKTLEETVSDLCQVFFYGQPPTPRFASSTLVINNIITYFINIFKLPEWEARSKEDALMIISTIRKELKSKYKTFEPIKHLWSIAYQILTWTELLSVQQPNLPLIEQYFSSAASHEAKGYTNHTLIPFSHLEATLNFLKKLKPHRHIPNAEYLELKTLDRRYFIIKHHLLTLRDELLIARTSNNRKTTTKIETKTTECIKAIKTLQEDLQKISPVNDIHSGLLHDLSKNIIDDLTRAKALFIETLIYKIEICSNAEIDTTQKLAIKYLNESLSSDDPRKPYYHGKILESTYKRRPTYKAEDINKISHYYTLAINEHKEHSHAFKLKHQLCKFKQYSDEDLKKQIQEKKSTGLDTILELVNATKSLDEVNLGLYPEILIETQEYFLKLGNIALSLETYSDIIFIIIPITTCLATLLFNKPLDSREFTPQCIQKIITNLIALFEIKSTAAKKLGQPHELLVQEDIISLKMLERYHYIESTVTASYAKKFDYDSNDALFDNLFEKNTEEENKLKKIEAKAKADAVTVITPEDLAKLQRKAEAAEKEKAAKAEKKKNEAIKAKEAVISKKQAAENHFTQAKELPASERDNIIKHLESALSIWSTQDSKNLELRKKRIEASTLLAAHHAENKEYNKALNEMTRAISIARSAASESTKLEELIALQKSYDPKQFEQSADAKKSAEETISTATKNPEAEQEQQRLMDDITYALAISASLEEEQERLQEMLKEEYENNTESDYEEQDSKSSGASKKPIQSRTAQIKEQEKIKAAATAAEKTKQISLQAKLEKIKLELQARKRQTKSAATQTPATPSTKNSDTSLAHSIDEKNISMNKKTFHAKRKEEKDRELVKLLFTHIIPEKTLNDFYDLSQRIETKSKQKLIFSGSMALKIAMLWLNDSYRFNSIIPKQDLDICKIPVGDLDGFIDSKLPPHSTLPNGETIEQMLLNEKIGSYPLVPGNCKPNPFFTNFNAQTDSNKEQAGLSFDLSLRHTRYTQAPNLIPSSNLKMYFSDKDLGSIGKLSIPFAPKRYLIVEEGKDGFFESCKHNRFTLSVLADPKDKAVTGYLDRLSRAAKKAQVQGMVIHGIAEIALTPSWQLYYLAIKFQTYKGPDACAREMLQILRHQSSSPELIKPLFKNYIRVLLLQKHREAYLSTTQEINRANKTPATYAAEEKAIGEKLIKKCQELKIDDVADFITDILLTNFKQEFSEISKLDTPVLLRYLNNAVDWAITTCTNKPTKQNQSVSTAAATPKRNSTTATTPQQQYNATPSTNSQSVPSAQPRTPYGSAYSIGSMPTLHAPAERKNSARQRRTQPNPTGLTSNLSPQQLSSVFGPDFFNNTSAPPPSSLFGPDSFQTAPTAFVDSSLLDLLDLNPGTQPNTGLNNHTQNSTPTTSRKPQGGKK